MNFFAVFLKHWQILNLTTNFSHTEENAVEPDDGLPDAFAVEREGVSERGAVNARPHCALNTLKQDERGGGIQCVFLQQLSIHNTLQ